MNIERLKLVLNRDEAEDLATLVTFGIRYIHSTDEIRNRRNSATCSSEEVEMIKAFGNLILEKLHSK